MPPDLDLVRINLPTPDVVLVRSPDGRLVMFADTSLTADVVDAAVRSLDEILAGTPYPLSAAS
jgi:hypothetical protein